MASWCGSTRSFCREQETQGRRRGEHANSTQEPGKGTGGYGEVGGGTVGGRALGKGALISILERSGEEISDTCNIYWKSSRPWPWR